MKPRDLAALHRLLDALPNDPSRERIEQSFLEGRRRGYSALQLLLGFESERYAGVAFLLAEALCEPPHSHAPQPAQTVTDLGRDVDVYIANKHSRNVLSSAPR